jgi:hypothetical protein
LSVTKAEAVGYQTEEVFYMKALLCLLLLIVAPLAADCSDRQTIRDSAGRTIFTITRDRNREVVRDETGRTIGTDYYDCKTEEARDASGRLIWRKTK